MKSAGFTLLELLLAISLTASVGLAALSLTTMQGRLGAAARIQEESLALITESVRLVNDDLLGAVRHPVYGRYLLQEQGSLRLVTTCRLPDEDPGLHEVVWRFDAAQGAVLRTSIPLDGGRTLTRAVGRGWTGFAIVSTQNALWLDARLGTSDIPWRVPLWTEAP